MKQLQRIEILRYLFNFNIQVSKIWWSPFGDISYKFIGSDVKITLDEYAYLVNNNYARFKEKIDENNILLEISDKGKERLNSLIHKVK
jgi:hypothetical protein